MEFRFWGTRGSLPAPPVGNRITLVFRPR